MRSPAYDGKGNAYVAFYGYNDTWLGQDYGIPAGTYKPMVEALGYLQQTQDLVSVTLSGTPILISNHLYRGVGFNFTVYSIDWEQPRVNRNWVWPEEPIMIGIYKEPGHKYAGEACDFCDHGFVGDPIYQTIPFLTTSDNGPYWVEVNGGGTGNANSAFFGIDVDPRYPYVGGRMNETAGVFTTGSAKTTWGLLHY